MGLIEHLDKNVPYPYKKDSNEVKWTNRIQQRINGWGKAYVGKEFDNNKYSDINNKIKYYLDNSRELLISYFEQEIRIGELRGDDKQRQKLHEKIRLIRDEIEERKGCIITF